ncbi:MAG TPA: outer membrane beta-barrel protein [Pirellulales bacterium]
MSDCYGYDPCRSGDCCCSQNRNTTLTGWFDLGIMGNGRNTADNFNGPLTFPDRNGEGQANQIWLSFDSSAPCDNCGWFVGGHVDYFFGSDFFFTTAAGLDGTPNGNVPRWNTDSRSLYGFAMPQLYVETDYNDLKIKWGHFFTILGYEVVPAVGNFFYSHAYVMQYGEPFTYTGFLATKPMGNWTWAGGLVAGWNTFDTNDRAAWLGGVTYADQDWGSLGFSIITGDDSESNQPGVGPFASRTLYSLVWSRNFTDRFTYVLQHDLGEQNNAQTPRGGGAQWFGINQYLFYKLNCCWTAGLRAEWFRDDDGFVVTGLRPGNAIDGASFPGDFYEITAGLNYKPNGNLAVRPEIRWDWYNGQPNQNSAVSVTSPYDAGTRNSQLTFGIDMVYQW